MKLVRENINFERGKDPKESMGLGIGLYGIYEYNYDETYIYFFRKEGDARSKFEEIDAGVLFKASGDGQLYSSVEFGSRGEVEILDEKHGEF
jgi:hypothetical protein